MKRKLIKLLSAAVCAAMFFSFSALAAESESPGMPVTVNAKSAILVDVSSGQVLAAMNEHERLYPASVTKIMTLLLVMEAIDSGKLNLNDTVVTSPTAAAKGGSQIWLKEGESMTVDELLRATAIYSANDACEALGEHIAGSEEAFVARMNERASELGMKNTHFENTNGLDDSVTNHLTSSRDIAIMSRELIKHEKILEFSSIWMDTIRDGAFGLTNTNRLIRFYKGANGLKTGSTSKALFCMSATAKRDGMQLIAVIMGAPTRDIRNEEAKKMLDFGFANYTVYEKEEETFENIKLLGGTENMCELYCPPFSTVIEKSGKGNVEICYELPEFLEAPISKGEAIGKVNFVLNGEKIGEVDILAKDNINRIGLMELFFKMWKSFFVS